MKSRLGLLAFSCVLFIGCQKSGTAEQSSSSLESASGSLDCQQGPSSNVSIVGLDQMKSGQKTLLSLSPGVNCKQAEKAVWRIGDSLLGVGSSVQAEIKGSGVYVVTVDLNSSNTGGSQNKTVESTSVSARVAVTNSGTIVTGPQIGFEDEPYQFSLAVPAGTTLTEAIWDFGDGSPTVSSLGPVQYSFLRGNYTIKVQVRDSSNQLQSLQHLISILPRGEESACALDPLEIVGPTEVPVQRRVSYTLNLSTCLKNRITGVRWNFGDGTNVVLNTQTAQHIFATVGEYDLSVELAFDGTTITLKRHIVVTENLEEMPGPITNPPTNPNQCLTAGATRSSDGATSTKVVACGINGQRTDTYKEQIIETCQMVNQVLSWVETSRQPVLVSEGPCMGQSCVLPTESGNITLADGESKTLYSSKTPNGQCSTVQQTRTCQNGVLSGTNAAQFLSCSSGCGDFGVHGTTQTGVVIGEISQSMTCQFGETGVVQIFNQITDRVCQNGQVQDVNTRQGELKTPGVCPTYSWTPTENWTQCSADCGGQQNRTFDCRNQSGAVSPADRCVTSAPVEARVCDGNPEAVKRSESTVTSEEAPSCATCPKNQIGVVVDRRDVTTTKTYACVDHQVQLANTVVLNGAWVRESYCRDFVPTRCSHDSLSNSQAAGREKWMQKCQNQIPAVKEFLTQLASVDRTDYHGKDRQMYPTFLDSSTKQPWIAPTSGNANCTAPDKIYVAAVCVSSCSTPEQQIIVEAEKEKKLKYMPFIEALTQNVPRVGTLHSASTMSSKGLQSTKVDNWVTELIDEEHQMLVFKMKSGGQLKVTLNHPMLSEEGVMRIASDFKVGDSLVQLGGDLDPIVSIEPMVHFGKVYNLFVKSNDLKHNVVVINGYLNGTAFYQNEGAKHLNRALLRKNLFRGAFESKGQ